VATLAEILEGHRQTLASLLPAYIAGQRWFGAKSRSIASAAISSTFPVGDAVIALVELTYTGQDETDVYQLPLALATEEEAAGLAASFPMSLITKPGDLPGGLMLYDASADAAFQRKLLGLTIAGESGGELAATRAGALDPARYADLPSRLSSAEQSNTSILYDSSGASAAAGRTRMWRWRVF
jgi:hypothetical protein